MVDLFVGLLDLALDERFLVIGLGGMNDVLVRLGIARLVVDIPTEGLEERID